MSDKEMFDKTTSLKTEILVWVPPSIERIFPVNSNFLEKTVTFVSDNSLSASSLVLEGSTKTCRTGLLFQAAVSYTQEGAQVAYVCPAPLTTLPPNVHGMHQPNPTSAQRLKMMYLPTVANLVDWLSSVHQQASPPEVLIVDDLHMYMTQAESGGFERSASRIFAHLLDAFSVMELRSENKLAHLIIGTDFINATISQTLPQFFQAVYSIKENSMANEFNMVPVVSTHHQVAGAIKRSHPLVGFMYRYKKDAIGVMNAYVRKT